MEKLNVNFFKCLTIQSQKGTKYYNLQVVEIWIF